MVRRILLSLVAVALAASTLLLPGPSGAEPVLANVTCAATEPMEGRGSVTVVIPIPIAQIGDPVAQTLSTAELPLPIPVDLAATDQILSGGTVDYAGGLSFDLGTGLEDAMVGVREAIAAAGYPQLAESLEVTTTLSDLAIPFPHPAGTGATGTPTATGDGVTAAHQGGALVVDVDEFVIDTEAGVDPVDADIAWSVLDGGTTPPAVLEQRLGTITFDLDVELSGIVPGEVIAPFVPAQFQPFIPANVPVTAGASGPWACVPDDPSPVLATTDVVEPATTTTTDPTSSTTDSTSTTSTTASTTSSTSSTTSTTTTTTVVDPPCDTGFSDVPPEHQFCPEVAWAVDGGLVNGWPDGTFRPVQPVSRQHFAAMLYRSAGSPPVADDAPTFTDVGPTHLFRDAIRWLAHEGITTGFDDGTFRPTLAISRQGIAAMFHRAAGSPDPAVDAPTFTDVGPTHLFRDEIGWLAGEGITTGYDDGTFRPAQAVSRQVIAAFFQRQAG